ncbi:MAG: hypothetical protein QOF89_5278 [Acidobacteriota bacterium]|nr:hypothetical protein [Acidobacteriota bacterium]
MVILSPFNGLMLALPVKAPVLHGTTVALHS